MEEAIYIDFNRREAQWYTWKQSRPVCDDCGEPILENYRYEDLRGNCTCEHCMSRKIHWVRQYTDSMKCCECGDTEHELSEYEGDLYCETCMDKLLEDMQVSIA